MPKGPPAKASKQRKNVVIASPPRRGLPQPARQTTPAQRAQTHAPAAPAVTPKPSARPKAPGATANSAAPAQPSGDESSTQRKRPAPKTPQGTPVERVQQAAQQVLARNRAAAAHEALEEHEGRGKKPVSAGVAVRHATTTAPVETTAKRKSKKRAKAKGHKKYERRPSTLKLDKGRKELREKVLKDTLDQEHDFAARVAGLRKAAVHSMQPKRKGGTHGARTNSKFSPTFKRHWVSAYESIRAQAFEKAQELNKRVREAEKAESPDAALFAKEEIEFIDNELTDTRLTEQTNKLFSLPEDRRPKPTYFLRFKTDVGIERSRTGTCQYAKDAGMKHGTLAPADIPRAARDVLLSQSKKCLTWSTRGVHAMLISMKRDRRLGMQDVFIGSHTRVHAWLKALKLSHWKPRTSATVDARLAAVFQAELRCLITLAARQAFPRNAPKRKGDAVLWPLALYINGDETACRVFPKDAKVWVRLDKAGLPILDDEGMRNLKLMKSAGSKKKVVTLTMSVTAAGTILTPQVIAGRCEKLESAIDAFEAKRGDFTSRQAIKGLQMDLVATKSHWINVATIRQLCASYEKHRKRVIEELKLQPGAPLIVVWDCAPQHVSTTVQAMLDKEFPNIWFACVPAGATSVLQPLDTDFFGAFKQALRTRHMSRFLERFATGNRSHVPSQGEASDKINRSLLLEAIADTICTRPDGKGRRQINSELGIKAGQKLLQIAGAHVPAGEQRYLTFPAPDVEDLITQRVDGRDDLFAIFRVPSRTPLPVGLIRNRAALPEVKVKRSDVDPDEDTLRRFADEFPEYDPGAVGCDSEDSDSDWSLDTQDLDSHCDDDDDPRPARSIDSDDEPLIEKAVHRHRTEAAGAAATTAEDEADEEQEAGDDEEEDEEEEDDDDEGGAPAAADSLQGLLRASDSDDDVLLPAR